MIIKLNISSWFDQKLFDDSLFLSHRFQIYQQLSSLLSNNIQSPLTSHHLSYNMLGPKPRSSLTCTQPPLPTDTLNAANSPLVFYHFWWSRDCEWSGPLLPFCLHLSPPTFLLWSSYTEQFLSQKHYLSRPFALLLSLCLEHLSPRYPLFKWTIIERNSQSQSQS